VHGHPLDRLHAVAHQDNIAVHVAEKVADAQLLRLCEQIAHERRPKRVSGDLWNVPHAQFRSDFRGAFIVPHEDDLACRAEQRPTTNGIPLNDSNMASKRFGSCKNCQHGILT
jgi:hypothetical protein